MAARAVIPFLVGMMLLTGVCNTLLTKFQVNEILLCIMRHTDDIVGHAMRAALRRSGPFAAKDLRTASDADAADVRRRERQLARRVRIVRIQDLE